MSTTYTINGTYIEITGATDFFQQTVQISNDIWIFQFRWLQNYSYFVVSATKNSVSIIQGMRVVGGNLVLPDWSSGYNFLFYDSKTITQTSDLDGFGFYYISYDDAVAGGLINGD